MLTIHEVERALPKNIRVSITQEMVNSLNSLSTDPVAAQNMRENFLSYSSVLKDGKFKLENYVHAVAYVSYKVMGYTNRDSYMRTFPARYQNLVGRGASDKDISAYVAAYNKNKLVNLILEQTLIPTWVLNQDIYQQAINVQADLMLNARSEKVKVDAANSLLTHLKKPEKKEVELNIGMKDDAGMNEMRETLHKMAEMQQQLIRDGMTTKQIADSKIIDAELADEE